MNLTYVEPAELSPILPFTISTADLKRLLELEVTAALRIEGISRQHLQTVRAGHPAGDRWLITAVRGNSRAFSMTRKPGLILSEDGKPSRDELLRRLLYHQGQEAALKQQLFHLYDERVPVAGIPSTGADDFYVDPEQDEEVAGG